MTSTALHLLRTGLVAVSVVLLPGLACADQALIDYRNSVMSAIGGHTTALVAIIKGDVPYTEDAKVHAGAIAPLAKIAEHIFPEASRTGKTDALPAIWEKPEKFKEAMAAFQTAAADLAKVADSEPKQMAGAFGNLGKACKGCHDDFRKKD